MSSNIFSERIKSNDMVISMKTVEWIGIWLLLFISFVNVAALTVSLTALLLFFRQQEIGAIKILNIITLRTIINPGLAIDIGSVQNLKWGIIFLCSFYLIISYRKTTKKSRTELNKLLLPIIIYGLYSVVSSFFTSNLPIVASFKLISYIVVFLSIIIGLFITGEKYDWLNWMHQMFMSVLLFSTPMIFSNIGYFRNGHAFQGITNQPNMFGIFGALFVALILSKVQLSQYKNVIIPSILISTVIYMTILSKSRTGLITILFLIVLFLILVNVGKIKKILAFNFIGFLTIIYVSIDDGLLIFINQFLHKGNENILSSRTHQLGGLMSNFLDNPILGNGFAVPITSFRSFSFSSKYVVEPGNLILAVLSYGGILGFILFLNYMIKILSKNRRNFKNYLYLFASPILISMGEMVFFSSNNIGIWLYMYLSIYVIMNKYQK